MNEADRYLQKHQQETAEQRKTGDAKVEPAVPPTQSQSNQRSERPTAGGQSKPKSRLFADWWSMDGRLGRELYIQRLLCILAGMGVGVVVLTIWATLAGEPSMMGRPIGAIVIFTSMPFAFFQHTRRLHDLGWSGWWQLLFWVPIFGLLFRAFLWLRQGTPGANNYGNATK